MSSPRLAATLLLTAACSGGARFPTTDPNEPAPPRRPAGLAVDPVSRLPATKSRGETQATLLVLSAPRSATLARSIIARYFQALVSESPEALDRLLSEQAFIDTAGNRQPARGALRSRFLQLDYTALRGVPLYREAELEIYRAEDADVLRAERSLPTDLAKDQLFVRVRVNVSHAGKTRVLANEIGFLLRPEQEAFRIVNIREDAPVP